MKIERLKAEQITPLVDWSRDFTSIGDDGDIICDYDDIIYKKLQLEKILREDLDLLEMLGSPEEIIPLETASEEEKKEIIDRNNRISKPEIIPWLKLNGIVNTVSNKVLFDICTERADYDNPAFQRQLLIVMCLVDETSMETDFGIPRVDLVSYIIKDLLQRTDALGMNLVLCLNEPKIIDNMFYCREMRFAINQPNFANSMMGTGNRYDRFR